MGDHERPRADSDPRPHRDTDSSRQRSPVSALSVDYSDCTLPTIMSEEEEDVDTHYNPHRTSTVDFIRQHMASRDSPITRKQTSMKTHRNRSRAFSSGLSPDGFWCMPTRRALVNDPTGFTDHWDTGEHQPFHLAPPSSRIMLKRFATTTSVPGEKSAQFNRLMITRSSSCGGIHSYGIHSLANHSDHPLHSKQSIRDRNTPKVLRSLSTDSTWNSKYYHRSYRSTHHSRTATSPTMTYAPANGARVLSETANSQTATYEFTDEHGPL